MPLALIDHPDGRARCSWCGLPGQYPDYRAYHDDEWGRPLADERRIFEKLVLEGFQSGLSWLTILRKRAAFRQAFADFDVPALARFGEAEVQALLANPGIVRHRGKIEAVINNAKRVQELVRREGSFAAYVWRFEPDPKSLGKPQSASTSAESIALSKDLLKQGWKFVGPTTVYAFMQAMGLVNDHVEDCVIRAKAARARKSFASPAR